MAKTITIPTTAKMIHTHIMLKDSSVGDGVGVISPPVSSLSFGALVLFSLTSSTAFLSFS
jgi:hypothetical protein